MALGDRAPEPRTSTSRPLRVAVNWISIGLPVGRRISAIASAIFSAFASAGARIGQ